MSEYIVLCPHCLSERIVEQNQVVVEYEIESFAIDDETCEIIIKSWGSSEVQWDTVAIMSPQFFCKNCSEDVDNPIYAIVI